MAEEVSAHVREQVAQEFSVRAVTGIPDVRPGDDLVAMLAAAAPWLLDGDIVAVTSKVVSKASGRLVAAPVDEDERAAARRAAMDSQTAAVVAERTGGVRIVRTVQGFTMAAAGIDNSNVRAGEMALLPEDCDAAAREIREGLRSRLGVEVAVIVTDTVGRPWRGGLVDIALGCSGIAPLRDLRGATDTHGHPLAVTALAQIDELAAASELVRGKLAGVAAAVIRGVPFDPVEVPAATLSRPLEEDMFFLGTRDVVPASADRPLSEPGDPALVAEAVRRTPSLEGVSVGVEDTQVRIDGADALSVGIVAGRLLVALRAEGLVGEIVAREPVLIDCRVSGPYRGAVS
ncbi:coenzyme F420-0:L-glutamate ligase [Epidermidibacterium keratini]|uniref:Coenzyme F420-0:L-glutamate ligase n=1 Tax=Epidermidibacterium keratini TaxID=1891644 RepID=A0A7L4YQL7_9ACTN|nr:coenzyme F420-0:L-glutamate ligase [Epidermidibacterium keratini]QHC01551.1 coenzyme F420-0:L-glutamate ligase [Epidermidibacterium keratini]